MKLISQALCIGSAVEDCAELCRTPELGSCFETASEGASPSATKTEEVRRDQSFRISSTDACRIIREVRKLLC